MDPTTSPTTTTASELVGCTAPGLLVTIEARPATMGSRYLAIVARNTTRHRCVIAGHPTVRAVDPLGQPVGSDATPEDIASRPVVLAPNATAQALVQVVRAGVLDPAACQPRLAVAWKVALPTGSPSQWLPIEYQACAGPAHQMTVRPFTSAT